MTEHGALLGLRVLVVEDEMLVSLLIEDALVDQGCVVVGPFSEVGPAEVAARTETLDLAVLDVNVKGVKTYPVAEALDRRGVPFVFLSGYGETAVPADRPNWKVCSKPFTERQLVNVLTQSRTASRGPKPAAG